MSSSLTFHFDIPLAWTFAKFFLSQRRILAAEVSKSVAGKHTSLGRTPNFGFLKGLERRGLASCTPDRNLRYRRERVLQVQFQKPSDFRVKEKALDFAGDASIYP